MTVAGAGLSFPCPEDRTILSAALRSGLAFPYECASGSCGSCKATLVRGEVATRWEGATGLSPRDRRKGRILCCQSEPRGPCEISIVGDADLTRDPSEPRPRDESMRVEHVEELGPSMASVALDAGRPLSFLAGQFYLLRLPDGSRRAYSMANAPDGSSRLELVVRAKPGGAGTRFVFEELAPGDVVHAEGPFGRAYLRAPVTEPIVCVAGGSGIAPMLSVATHALRSPAVAAPGHVHVVYGCRRREDLVCGDALAEIARHPGARVTVALSDPTPGDAWGGPVGLVGDVMLREESDLHGKRVYAAGPPAMVDAVLRACVLDRGVPADRIHFDRFS